MLFVSKKHAKQNKDTIIKTKHILKSVKHVNIWYVICFHQSQENTCGMTYT